MIEARMDIHLNLCRWCDRQVVWAYDAKNVSLRFPCDADMDASTERGNLILTRDASGDLLATLPTEGQAKGMVASGHVLYAHHALTCPKAASWHKVKEHGKAHRKFAGKR